MARRALVLSRLVGTALTTRANQGVPTRFRHVCMIVVSAAGACLLALPAGAAPSQDKLKADLIFRNGYIFTADPRNSTREAVALRGGRIVYVGSNAGVAELIGPTTRTIDLGHRMMMPGLVDGHIHPLMGGAMLRSCSLDYQPLTEQQFLSRIQACLDNDKTSADSDLLIVTGWYRQFMRPAGTAVSRDTLDKLQTKRPVLVTNRDRHSYLANSRALVLAGINDKTANPPGGSITRDRTGRATGILEDAAGALVHSKSPARSPADDLADGAATFQELSRNGVTSILDALAEEDSLKVYRQLQQQGKLTARTHVAVYAHAAGASNAGDVVANVVRLRNEYDQPVTGVEPGIRVHTAKLVMDGVIQAPAQTAGLTAPYWVNVAETGPEHWQPGTQSGPIYIRQDMLEGIVLGLVKSGIEPHVHAIGDKAVKLTLDAIAKVRLIEPGDNIRPAIAHAELVEPVDYRRFKALNVVPVMSYQWTIPAPNSVTGAKNQLGPERFERMEPFDKLHGIGARVVYGSDWPVDRMNYWLALKAAVTRAGDGTYAPEFEGRLNHAGTLDRVAALRSITIDGAWALHLDKDLGSIEKGKLADLIVLDRNFLTIPESTLAENKVVLTVVGGRVVHDDGVLK